jgi:hypothetical protein
MLSVFFVFQTDFVDELRIGPELLPQRDRPRPRIRFGILHVTSISRCPKSGRRIRSRTLAVEVTTLPFQSIHRSSRNPIVSTTRVSPSHFADEYPCHDGLGSPGSAHRPRIPDSSSRSSRSAPREAPACGRISRSEEARMQPRLVRQPSRQAHADVVQFARRKWSRSAPPTLASRRRTGLVCSPESR